MIRLLVLIGILCLCGCNDVRYVPTSAPSVEAEHQEVIAQKRRAELAEQATADQKKTIAELKAGILADNGVIADARQDIESKRKLITQKEDEHIQFILSWVAGLLAIAALFAAVAAWFSPIGKRLLFSLAVICGALVPVVLAARAYVHYLPMIGIVFIALAAAVAWILHLHAGVLRETVGGWRAAMGALPTETQDALNRASLARQEATPRIKAALDGLLAKAKGVSA